MIKITSKRRELLQAVYMERVWQHWPIGPRSSYSRMTNPNGPAETVTRRIKELESAGLVRLGPMPARPSSPRLWVLTASGVVALTGAPSVA